MRDAGGVASASSWPSSKAAAGRCDARASRRRRALARRATSSACRALDDDARRHEAGARSCARRAARWGARRCASARGCSPTMPHLARLSARPSTRTGRPATTRSPSAWPRAALGWRAGGRGRGLSLLDRGAARRRGAAALADGPARGPARAVPRCTPVHRALAARAAAARDRPTIVELHARRSSIAGHPPRAPRRAAVPLMSAPRAAQDRHRRAGRLRQDGAGRGARAGACATATTWP